MSTSSTSSALHPPRSEDPRFGTSAAPDLLTKTQFDANLLEPDSKLDGYTAVRAALGKKMKDVLATADEPGVVADVVLEAASAAHPKLRYTAGSVASRVRLLRRFAPARLVDAGIRRDLQLDAPTASLPRTPVLAK